MAQLTNDLKADYQRRFDTCVIRPNRMADVDALVAQIASNRKRYAAAGNPVGTPWYVVGVIHALESSLNFGRHLHNGDPLTARTVQVPAGQAQDGAATVHVGGERERRAPLPGLRQVEGLVDPRDVVQARGLQRLRLSRPPPRRALAVSLELLDPLQLAGSTWRTANGRKRRSQRSVGLRSSCGGWRRRT